MRLDPQNNWKRNPRKRNEIGEELPSGFGLWICCDSRSTEWFWFMVSVTLRSWIRESTVGGWFQFNASLVDLLLGWIGFGPILILKMVGGGAHVRLFAGEQSSSSSAQITWWTVVIGLACWFLGAWRSVCGTRSRVLALSFKPVNFPTWTGYVISLLFF